MEEEVLAFSYALNPKGVTTASYTSRIHKCSLRVLQQLFNDRFRRSAIYDFGVDHVVP
jgi:hypothetical protein